MERRRSPSPSSGVTSQSRVEAPAFALLAAALLALAVFLNSLGGAFVYDDLFEIRDNTDLHRLSFVLDAFTGKPWGAERGYGFTYRPLSLSAATVLYHLGGGSPLPFHAANILLNALNVLLLGLLLHRMLAETDRPRAPLGILTVPVAAAFLFASHPVHSETVAWASGRSDLLATAFLLGAWLVFAGSRGVVGKEIASAVLLLAALFCKETAVAGLLLLPLSVVGTAFARGAPAAGALRRFPIRAWLFHCGAFVAYLVARVAALGQIGRGTIRGSEMLNPLVGADPLSRILTSLALLPEHVRLLVWPARLSIEYSFDEIPLARTFLDPRVLGPIVLILAGLAILWKLDGAWGRPVLTLSLVYGAAALPTSNLLPLPATIFSERYLYLPSAVFCLAAALALVFAARRRRAAAVAALALLVAVGSFRSMERNRDWRDAESLYRSSIAAAPRAARLHYNLGVVFRDQGRAREAEASFARALEIAPRYADARAERGVALIALGRPGEATKELRQAASDAPGDPVILNDLGGAYLSIGKAPEALPLLRRAIEIDPRSTDALSNLGRALLDLRDAAGAIRAFRSAAEIDPNDAASYVGLGAAQAAGGDLPSAVESFRRAFSLSPDDDDAAFNLARALLGSGEAAAALPILEKLAAKHPGDAEIARSLDQARTAAPR